MAVSTASAWRRKLSPLVYSHRSSQASARSGICPFHLPDTVRWQEAVCWHERQFRTSGRRVTTARFGIAGLPRFSLIHYNGASRFRESRARRLQMNYLLLAALAAYVNAAVHAILAFANKRRLV